ncbi:uncharacterized protein LOC100613546 [Pan troglodytes]|uniref:uncharacterized protein LOC100613546 n=1 Tax=Pan troglodytes TaxID=9598 RepID=UPI0023F48390|nr:uncharacterized protein LOC100613546 [Pan troglodytes]
MRGRQWLRKRVEVVCTGRSANTVCAGVRAAGLVEKSPPPSLSRVGRRFRFCGDLDCPDRVLAEIRTLAKMYKKILKLTADAKFVRRCEGHSGSAEFHPLRCGQAQCRWQILGQ